MDLTQIPLFAAMAKHLQWLTARQDVIAENVANANTPGFKGADLKPLDFTKVLAGEPQTLQLATTDPQHLSTPLPIEPGAGSNFERTPAAHPVSIEDQMMKLSETASDFSFITGLYQKQIALIKDAIGH